eukprot:scaffold159113_cov15-Tisochrysis_lutea.AAC.2
MQHARLRVQQVWSGPGMPSSTSNSGVNPHQSRRALHECPPRLAAPSQQWPGTQGPCTCTGQVGTTETAIRITMRANIRTIGQAGTTRTAKRANTRTTGRAGTRAVVSCEHG